MGPLCKQRDSETILRTAIIRHTAGRARLIASGTVTSDEPEITWSEATETLDNAVYAKIMTFF